MTDITFTFQEKSLIGIEAKGHSGYSEKGSDIVCASISTLMYTLIYGLTGIEEIPSVMAEINDKENLIRASWLKKFTSKTKILTRAIEKSFRQLALKYPDYVKISEVYI